LHNVDVVARYEFRTWGSDLNPTAARLADAGSLIAVRSSRENYLAIPGSLEVNPKIRDNMLDVKVLRQAVNGFEQWEPHLKQGFPVSAAWLRAEFFPTLGLEAPGLPGEKFAQSDFLDQVALPHPMIDVVEVLKDRKIYDFGSALGETAMVAIAGVELATVAIEASDVAVLEAMRSRLGLNGYENQSYPRVIRAVLERSDD
jgi:hypothetical protein